MQTSFCNLSVVEVVSFHIFTICVYILDDLCIGTHSLPLPFQRNDTEVCFRSSEATTCQHSLMHGRNWNIQQHRTVSSVSGPSWNHFLFFQESG